MSDWYGLNYVDIVLTAIQNARQKRIELLPLPDFGQEFCRAVVRDTPKGHYIGLDTHKAQIIVVDDYRPSAGMYDDLVPGYRLARIFEMTPGDDDEAPLPHKFVSVEYYRA